VENGSLVFFCENYILSARFEYTYTHTHARITAYTVGSIRRSFVAISHGEWKEKEKTPFVRREVSTFQCLNDIAGVVAARARINIYIYINTLGIKLFSLVPSLFHVCRLFREGKKKRLSTNERDIRIYAYAEYYMIDRRHWLVN